TFDELDIDSDFDVVIQQSDSTYVIAEGCDTDLKKMKVTDGNKKLSLFRKVDNHTAGVSIRIGTPELVLLHTDGVVKVQASGFQTDRERRFTSGGTSRISFIGNASAF